MPTILQSEKCLDGKGTLLTYERDPQTVYLRVWKPETKSYSTRKVPGASSIEEARQSVLDTFLEIASPTPSKPRRGAEQGTVTKPHRQRIEDHLSRWLDFHKERENKGLLEATSFRVKRDSMSIIRKFLKEEGLVFTNQIEVGCFDSYELWRANYSPWTRQKELKVLKSFIAWLARQNVIEPYLALRKDLIPRVEINDEDYDSNPPWRASDLKLFWEEVHRWVKDAERNESPYVLLIRRQTWTLFKFLRDSGLRPCEALNLKWADLEFENVYRFSQTQFEKSVGQLQAEGEPVDHLLDLPEDHPQKWDLGKVDRFVVHIRTLDTKTKRNRLVTCNGAENLLRWKDWVSEAQSNQVSPPKLSPSSPVFATPEMGEWRKLKHSTYQRYFRDVLMPNLEDKLRGAEMTSKPYKVYSFRSTRAQELKANGVEIGLAAEQMGHSPDVMAKVYARLPVKELATRQAAALNYGRTRMTEVIDIFNE